MRTSLTRGQWTLILIVALGAVLRFATISHASIWHDEGYSLYLAQTGAGEIIDATARDVHPPLYNLLLHYWTELFGRSEAAARGLSAVFGIGVIPLAYGIMRRLFSERAGQLSALFVALAPFLVRFSQEARMYAQVAFFTALATYLLVRALEDGLGSRRRWLWWVGYALAIAASVYTQYYGVLVIVAHGGYVLLRSDRFKHLWRFLAAGMTAALLFLPWAPIMLSQVGRVSDGYWIQKSWITIHTIPSSIYQFFFYDHLDRWLPGFWHELPVVLLALVTVAAAWRFRARWREVGLLLMLFLVPMIIIWLYSKLRTPVYQDRYFPFAALGFYLLASLWALTPRGRIGRVAATVIVSGLLLVGNGIVYASGSHTMREVAQAVNQGFASGDEIISLETFTYFDFSFYNKTGREAKLYHRGTFEYNEPGLLKGREDLRVRDLRSVPSGRVWAVGKSGEKSYWREVPPHWQLQETARQGSIEIRLYRVPVIP